MSNDNNVTLVGNCTRDPELRFTSSGQAVTDFGIAINSRKKVNDEWVDGDPQFFDVTCWAQMAENVAESLAKGNRVIVAGRMNFSQWENKQGDKRSKVNVVADAVGPDLRWATAEVVRNERSEHGATSQPTSKRPEQGIDPEEEPF